MTVHSIPTGALPVLRVRELSVDFDTHRGTVRVLDGVSFEVAPGEILGVVGESGAGKSMTGAAVIGLIETDRAQRIGNAWNRRSGLRIASLDLLFRP